MDWSLIPPLRPTFEAALRDVRARGERFRRAAASRLADPPEEQHDTAVAGLLELAKDPAGSVRQAAIESLGELGVESALPLLVAAFDDPNSSVRQTAVQAAVRIAPKKAREAISALLIDARPDMRFVAVVELADLDVPADTLAKRLDDDDPGVRVVAALALGALGEARAIEPLRRALGVRDAAFDAAMALGELRATDAAEDLATIAERRWSAPFLRAAAAASLVKIGDSRGVPALRAILTGWRIEAKSFAVQLVGELDLTELTDEVVALSRSRRKVQPSIMRETLQRLAPHSEKAARALESLDDLGQNPADDALRQPLSS